MAAKRGPDSTHVLSAARELRWLEMVSEALRSALNALAQAAPQWLDGIAEPDWFRHYATRAEDSRFPKARSRREEIGRRIGNDGMRLLQAVISPDAPCHLRALPQVEVLRQIWVQHFRLVEGEVQRRDPKDRPPGTQRLVTPFDAEARTGSKRDLDWDGYKVHLTETCGPDVLHLITNVVTTAAAVNDDRMAAAVHAGLARRKLLPEEHWVDTGYANSPAMVAARRDYGVELHGPLQAVNSVQSSRGDGAWGQDAFTIDWDNQRVTCPNGRISRSWAVQSSQRRMPVIRIAFSVRDCRPCPRRSDCLSTPTAQRRQLTLRPREEYDTLQQTRAVQQTDEWKERYQIRAGVEGTVAQGVQRCGLRRSRYRGLAKTSLQHQLTGAAINLARIDAHLTGIPGPAPASATSQHFAPPIQRSAGRSKPRISQQRPHRSEQQHVGGGLAGRHRLGEGLVEVTVDEGRGSPRRPAARRPADRGQLRWRPRPPDRCGIRSWHRRCVWVAGSVGARGRGQCPRWRRQSSNVACVASAGPACRLYQAVSRRVSCCWWPAGQRSQIWSWVERMSQSRYAPHSAQETILPSRTSVCFQGIIRPSSWSWLGTRRSGGRKSSITEAGSGRSSSARIRSTCRGTRPCSRADSSTNWPSAPFSSAARRRIR